MAQNLQAIVDEQKSQLENYEKKLKDVVSAYKSLQTEKKALEVALSAVSGEKSEQTPAEDGSEPINEIDSLKQAITTLTVENKKKELAFQADKRLLLSKNEKLQTIIDSIQASSAKPKDLQKYQEKLRRTEEEREKLISEHGIMLNNMQKKYAEQVTKVKKCEQTITDLYKQIHTKDQQLQANSSIVTQFEKIQDEMLRWKKQAENTPRESILIHQLEEIKKTHKAELQLERSKRTVSQSADQTKEGRIAELENRVEDLVRQVALTEQAKVTLQEQVEKASNYSDSHPAISNEPKNNRLTFVKLYEKLRSSENFDVYDVLSLKRPSERVDVEQPTTTHTVEYCKKCNGDNKELVYFKSVINHLQSQVKVLEEDQEQTKKSHEEVAKYLRKRIAELEEHHEKTYNELTSETKAKVTELEQELQKQRERMTLVVEEKNREIEIVKHAIEAMRRDNSADPMDPPQCNSPEMFNSSADDVRTMLQNSFEGDIFPTNRKRSSGQFGDTRNVFYEQELEKLEREITELRNVLRLCEQKIGDMEQATLTKDIQYLQIIDTLKEEVRILEGKLDLHTTDTNMEYLRNIFVQFLNSPNSAGRKCVLRAMGLVLKLTQIEMKKLESGSF